MQRNAEEDFLVFVDNLLVYCHFSGCCQMIFNAGTELYHATFTSAAMYRLMLKPNIVTGHQVEREKSNDNALHWRTLGFVHMHI